MRRGSRGVLGGWLLLSLTACASASRVSDGRAGAVHAETTLALSPVLASSRVAVVPPPELYVRCDDAASCPSAVGMLVVDEDTTVEPERCTATLIAPDRALTASHCLAASTRHAGASCARTWLVFPESTDAAAEWVGCARVEFAAEVVSEDALHQEHAVLKLTRSLERAPLQVDATPPAPGSIVTVASVRPHPIYGSTHLLSTRLCRAIDSEPAQQALGQPAANVGWLAHCPIARGNSGSPVLDYEQHIRAIVHGGTNLSSAFGVTSAPR